MSEETVRSARKGETLTSAIAKELKRGIISGQLAPGSKLPVRQLADRFGVGQSPVREALNRLSRDWLVRQSDQRGFSVAPISEGDLAELMKARCWLNDRALRELIARGDAQWEENILLAFHRMSRVPRRQDEASTDVNVAWETAHRAFHRSLVEGCGSQWIAVFCDQLFDIADIYRHVARSAPGALSREGEDEHRHIMEAVINRETDRAADLLERHLMRTAELYRRAVQARDVPPLPR